MSYLQPIVVFVLLFLFGNIAAQNNVLLSSSNDKLFKVIADGKKTDDKLQAHVLLEKVVKDTLKLELEFENRKKIPVVVYLLEKGKSCRNKEFSYAVDFNDVQARLVFMDVYDIQVIPEPIIPAKPVVDTSSKMKNRPFEHFCEWHNGRAVYYNNLPKEGNCKAAMPDQYLVYSQQLLDKADVDNEKLTVVENVVKNNCLSTAQLSTLLSHIRFEVDKLKIARLAYPHLIDPDNRKELEKNFRFDASVRELNSLLKDASRVEQAGNNRCAQPASEMIVASYAEKLSIFGNDAERLEALKKSYSDLCYSVLQVEQVLSKFIHDREKLEAARLLYFNCVEKGNFMKITGVFSYNQSISELQDFIDKQSH